MYRKKEEVLISMSNLLFVNVGLEFKRQVIIYFIIFKKMDLNFDQKKKNLW